MDKRFLILSCSTVTFNLLDSLTTEIALSKGKTEGTPTMALCFDKFPNIYCHIAKFIVVILVLVLIIKVKEKYLPYKYKIYLIGFITAFFFLLVVNNVVRLFYAPLFEKKRKNTKKERV